MSETIFNPTCWTLVLNARGDSAEAKVALSDLCAAYYQPVIAFLRREGRSDDSSRELAHAFFAGILESGLGAPEQARGRFRSYLLGALNHFLSKGREASSAAKRGGDLEHVPLASGADTSPGFQMPGVLDDTLAFDREWALALIGRSLARLEMEHAEKEDLFIALKPWLDGSSTASQAEAAQALGMSETAVKVAIHRLRVRFRELIRAEIAATVSDPADIAGELSHLIAIASAS